MHDARDGRFATFVCKIALEAHLAWDNMQTGESPAPRGARNPTRRQAGKVKWA